MGRSFEPGDGCTHFRFLDTIQATDEGFLETEWCPVCQQTLDVMFIPKGPSPRQNARETERRYWRDRKRRQYGG